MNFSWIGTGIMGRSMCSRLMKAGNECTVFNRTRAKAQDLLDAGARWAESPAEAARSADVVFTMVGYPVDVEDVILNPTTGVLAGFRENPSKNQKILVDCTTSRPSLAEKIASEAAKQGIWSLDAPVSGGDVGARNGTLSIMVGGPREAFDALEPLWKLMGTNVRWQGGPGMGQHTKMVNQILIAGNMMGMCEALRYAQTVGLDVPNALESVATGAAGSWSLSNLGPRILRGDFAPGFKITHFVKDLRIALEEAHEKGLNIPAVQLAEKLYSELMERGLAEEGTQALMKY